jgi:hypothetical protein
MAYDCELLAPVCRFGLETLDANGKELAYDENAYPRG